MRRIWFRVADFEETVWWSSKQVVSLHQFAPMASTSPPPTPRIWRPHCSKRAALHRVRALAQHRLAPQLLPIPASLPFTPKAPLTSDFSSKKGEWLQQVKGTQKKADLDNLVTSLREELGQLRVAKVCV